MGLKLKFEPNPTGPSELGSLLEEQMALKNVNLFEVYKQVVLPLLKANGNTPIIPYLGVLFKAYMNQTLEAFMLAFAGDELKFENPANVGTALNKFENRCRKETKVAMDLFMYTDDLLKPTAFAILEEQQPAVQKLCKLLGFEKLKKEQQIQLFVNIPTLV